MVVVVLAGGGGGVCKYRILSAPFGTCPERDWTSMRFICLLGVYHYSSVVLQGYRSYAVHTYSLGAEMYEKRSEFKEVRVHPHSLVCHGVRVSVTLRRLALRL